MKLLHLLTIASLMPVLGACKKLQDQRIKTGSLRNQSGPVEGAQAEEKKPAAKPTGPLTIPASLVGIWASPCGTLNSANKNQMEVFARQIMEFQADGKLIQDNRVYTDDTCGTSASEEMVRDYFSGFDLPAEDVEKAVDGVLKVKEDKTFVIASISDNGSLEVNITSSDGSILYTSIAQRDGRIIMARECLASGIEKGQCSEISGDSDMHRAKNLDMINSYEKLPR